MKAFLKAGVLGEDGVLRDNDTGTRRVGFSPPCSPTWPCRCWTSISPSIPAGHTLQRGIGRAGVSGGNPTVASCGTPTTG